MLLNELVGIKKHTKYSLDELVKIFEKESGYKKLGSGNFAYAFKHPSKHEVLKLWVANRSRR